MSGQHHDASHMLRITTTIPLALGALAISTTAHAQVTVGQAAQISVDQDHAAHTEAFAAADPGDARRLAVCSMVIDPTRSRLTSALYLSQDRGETWRMAVHDTTSRYGRTWDPACAIGPGGTVWFATLPSQRDPTKPPLGSITRVYRSPDGGATWEPPMVAPWVDNEDLAVDGTDGPYRGRAYVVGVRLSDTVPGRRHVSLLYADETDRSFQGPVDMPPPPGTNQGTVGAPVVAGDGRLVVPFILRRARTAAPASDDADSIPAQAVGVVQVFDGGTRFGTPVRVAAVADCPDRRSPVVAVDRSSGPFGNRMYLAYMDGAHGRCQIMLSWSDDGERWSAPLAVDDPAVPVETGTGPDAFLPQIGVNDRGVVGISWYDRRDDPANLAFRHRFTASVDGGASVLRSVPVSTHAHGYADAAGREPYFPLGTRFNADSTGALWLGVTTGRAQRTYYEVGDYGGMSIRADGVFQPLWVDNRTGVPQLFTAPVRVTAEVKPPAERDAALGRLISDSVTVVVTRTTFDAAGCTVDLGVDVINRHARAVALPLVVRVDEMLSQLGAPVAVGGERDDVGRPLWRIGSGGTLPPGGTRSHAAIIELEDCRPLAGQGAMGYRQRLDVRLSGTPTAFITGPKVLALKLRVFEPSP